MARDQGVKTPAKGPAAKAVRAPALKPAASAPIARKTTWTPWRETWITSVMVAVMIVLTAIFFSVVDGFLNFLMQQFLRFAAGG